MIFEKKKLENIDDYEKIDYLFEEKKGLEEAVVNLENRYNKKQISRDDFIESLKDFQEKRIDLDKRIKKSYKQ